MLKEIRLSLAIIVGSLVVFWGVFYFFQMKTNALADEIVQRRSIIKEHSTLGEVLASLKSDAQVAEGYEAAIDVLIPPKDKLFVGLSSWLQSQERLFGVSVRFSFQGNESDPTETDLGVVGFSMTVNGQLGDVVRFLRSVETQADQFLLRFNSIDVARDINSYRVSVGGDVFFK